MTETDQQRREKQRQEDLKRLRILRPMDDEFMRCIFRDNIPLVQLVLRIITGKKDLIVESIETQFDLKRLAGARSVILDVHAVDSDRKHYNIEIERSDKGASVYRARYHASAMDIENLHSSQNFDELPETYVIFITEDDIRGDGKPLHRIERVDIDSDGKTLFNDGEHIIYVNGAYRGDSDIGKLMHDFNCSDPEDMNFDLMKESSRYYKETPEGVETMSRVFEEIRDEAEKRGEKRGEHNRAVKTAERMIARGKMTLGEIAEDTGLSLEEVQKLAGKKSA